MNHIFILFLSAIIFCSTAHSEQYDPAKISKMDWVKQCALFGKILRGQVKDKNDSIMGSLKSNSSYIVDIRGEDYEPIRVKRPNIGMRLCAIVAAIGRPDHSNQTHTALGEHIQAIYPNGMFVYIDNGVVTGWQE